VHGAFNLLELIRRPRELPLHSQNGDREKSGVKTLGYAAYGLADRAPRQVIVTCHNRPRIERKFDNVLDWNEIHRTNSVGVLAGYEHGLG